MMLYNQINGLPLDIHERQTLAWDSDTQPEILAVLSKDNDSLVRSGVAFNPSTPLEVLESITQDVNPNTRYNITRNPNASSKILVSLAQDEMKYAYVYIRRGVAKHPNTPYGIWVKDYGRVLP